MLTNFRSIHILYTYTHTRDIVIIIIIDYIMFEVIYRVINSLYFSLPVRRLDSSLSFELSSLQISNVFHVFTQF